MLIVTINTSYEKDFKGRFFKKQISPEPFKRSAIKICGKYCVLLELCEKTLGTINLERLLNTFKGDILCSANVSEKLVPVEFRFDCEQYFKRALLSSLINNLGESARHLSICIKDSAFVFSDEYLTLANCVKSFTLVSKENKAVVEFSSRCFEEYGNFITISDEVVSADLIVNFKNLETDGKTLIIRDGRNQLLYPDPRYFVVKEDLLPLVNMGINPKIVCSAFSVIT